MDNKDLYNERVELLKTTIEHKEPKRVPVMGLLENYALAYAGATIADAEESYEKEIELFSKIYKEIYFDAIFGFGLSTDSKLNALLNGAGLFVSEDGTTRQHREVAPMAFEDYPELINDPESYLFNRYLSLRFDAFNGSYEEKKAAIRPIVAQYMEFSNNYEKKGKYVENQLGLVNIAFPTALAPLDLIFDFLRGFKGTITDLRRNQQIVKEAADSIVDFMINSATFGQEQVPDFPWLMTPLHIPPFISPKVFGEVYWPSYKKVMLEYHRRGGKAIIFLEGNWENKYEFLQELPKGFACGILEHDNVFNFKKVLGDRICICGGMRTELLKYDTKEVCIDYAKKLVDELAPGGGYIFSTDKDLLSPNDVNAENFKAVCEFVHEYGVYK